MLLPKYLLSVFLPVLVSALGQQAVISFSQSSGSVALAGHDSSPSILIDNGDWAGVVRAANDLATDFGLVTGLNGTVSQTTSLAANGNLVMPMIVVGTIGKSKLIETLVQEGKIDVAQTEGQWEAFHTQLVMNVSSSIPQALVVAGSDKRGSIYGVYDISEQIGVSPWYWWADVPAQHQTNVYALNVTKMQASPTVKYRGLFLNDEQPALNNWVQSNYADVTYLVDGVPNSGQLSCSPQNPVESGQSMIQFTCRLTSARAKSQGTKEMCFKNTYPPPSTLQIRLRLYRDMLTDIFRAWVQS